MTGPQLRRWRRLGGATQREAAAYFEISERMWRRYEKGQYPVPRTVRIIAKHPAKKLPGWAGSLKCSLVYDTETV